MLEDQRPRFEEVLTTLEAAAGWQTGRVQKPVAILGRLDGVMTGIRQLRRTRPLETEVVSGLRHWAGVLAAELLGGGTR